MPVIIFECLGFVTIEILIIACDIMYYKWYVYEPMLEDLYDLSYEVYYLYFIEHINTKLTICSTHIFVKIWLLSDIFFSFNEEECTSHVLIRSLSYFKKWKG